MTKHHGMTELAGQASYCKRNHSPTREDRFGRMFPDLAPAFVPADVLREVGKSGGPMDGGSKAKRTKSVPVGHVFFGQFIDHDITLDVTSSFNRVNDPAQIPNVRTPTLDLDCLYGSGPEASNFLYDGAKLLTGADQEPGNVLRENDLQRAPNEAALIGDFRNDENRIVSQLQLGMVNFHNHLCDVIHGEHPEYDEEELHAEARRETTWHYQWAVVNDFLPAMCGAGPVKDILSNGRQYYCPVEPFIPVEFSVAAYRFGHSMAPMKLQIQNGAASHELFGPDLGQGFSPLPSTDAVVDWREVLFHPKKTGVQRAEKMDTTMAGDLLQLPFVGAGGEASLATRNLLRGNSFLLPGGDRVAQKMGRSAEEIDEVTDKVRALSNGKIDGGVPLWLYILAEAEVIGREDDCGNFEKGEGLGPVGARIVAEVIIGLLELDPNSFLGADRNWTPREAYDNLGKILVSQNSSLF